MPLDLNRTEQDLIAEALDRYADELRALLPYEHDPVIAHMTEQKWLRCASLYHRLCRREAA